MNYEQEFQKAMQELNQQVQSDQEYEILGIAAVLQKLLLGDFPLLEIAASQKDGNLSFAVNNFPPNAQELQQSFWSLGAAYDPDQAPNSRKKVLALGKNQFLLHRIMIVNENKYTVLDVIRRVSVICAPLQAFVAKSVYDSAMERLSTVFGGHSDTGLEILKALGRIVLKTAAPYQNVNTI